MSIIKHYSLAILAVITLTFVSASCSDDDNNPMNSTTPEVTSDIVETAIAAGNFTTLVAAVQAAGLTDVLKGDGPYTVFAPTDEAFAALPEGTVESLLNDIPTLSSILTYHVVAGEVTSAQVVNLSQAQTVNGADVSISVTNDGNVMVDDATVIATDIKASNGVIHVIDAVILPPALRLKGIYDLALESGLTTLAVAVEAAGLSETLNADGPFTVFAPTNEAFAALPAGTLDALLQDTDALSNILLYHVVSGEVKAADVVGLSSATMLNSGTVNISVSDGVQVNDANVLQTDIQARNGVVHLIDKVLIP